MKAARFCVRKMNTLFLSELFYPHGSGGDLATYLYAKLLNEAGVNVIVVTNRFAGEPNFSKMGNLTVYRLPLFNGKKSGKYSILQRLDVLFASFMRKTLKWADVVYVPRFWYSAIPLAKAYGKPVVTHLHGYILICPLATTYDASKNEVCNHSLLCQPKCIYAYEREQGRSFTQTLTSTYLNSTLGRQLDKLIKLSDVIICVSNAQKNLIIKKLPSLCKKIHVIYNPLPELPYIAVQGDDFGYFSGPDTVKGFYVLLRALTRINRYKQVRVHATNFPDPEKSKSLSRLGIIPYKRIDYGFSEKLYRQIRAVVIPSICPEPLPYVVSEAILRGRMVIASEVGGIREQVEDCKGAFLFQAGNHERLAELIEYVYNLDKQAALNLGVKNREAFLKGFDNKRVLQAFKSMLDKTVSS